MSYHLVGDYEMAQSILEEFRKTQPDRNASSKDKVHDNEHSEFLLYQNLVLREAGQYEEALRHLQTHEKDIYNKLALAEIKYDLYMRLGSDDRAETILRDLIERNPNHKKYYLTLEKCLHLSNTEEKLKLYQNLMEKYPKADAPKQISLEFLTGKLCLEKRPSPIKCLPGGAFSKFIGSYLQNGFRKGIPSLFQSVKFLYTMAEKVRDLRSRRNPTFILLSPG